MNNLNNYDTWLEEPYQRKERENMEWEYKMNLLQTEFTVQELWERLSPIEQLRLHEIIIEEFEETLLNSLE